MDGLCEEMRTVYRLMGCYWHSHTYMPFRDVATLCGGDTLAHWEVRTDNGLPRARDGRRICYQSAVGVRV